MSDFKAKMHQIQFPMGLRPRHRWGSSQCSHRLPSWLWGIVLLTERRKLGRGHREGKNWRKGRGEKEEKRQGKERKGKEKGEEEEKGGKGKEKG